MDVNEFFFQEKYLETPFVQIGLDFARLHVEAALKAAAENAETETYGVWGFEGWMDDYRVDKNSILNSYPLDNIK